MGRRDCKCFLVSEKYGSYLDFLPTNEHRSVEEIIEEIKYHDKIKLVYKFG